MQFLSFLTYVSVLFIAGCGQPTTNGSKKVFLTKADRTEVLNNQYFECASLDGKPCPAGVARVLIYNPDEPNDSSVCSGFLSARNLLVTNNHCLSTHSQCLNTYISVYNGSTYEVARCKNIIKTQVDGRGFSRKGVDFTIMELDRLFNIEPLVVSNKPAFVGETLTAWVVDPVTLSKARITELSCLYQSFDRSMRLTNCPAIQGNSGGPVTNRDGEIVGVLWGSNLSDDIDADFPIAKRRNLIGVALATEIGFLLPYLL